jgi:hypothetical protein
VGDATWSVELLAGGDVVAEIVARRPLDDVEFDPLRFAAVVQGLVARHMSATVCDGATIA